MTPKLLKHRDAIVPCGRCPECKGRRVSSWSFRLMQEAKIAESAHFITLTYDTKNTSVASGRLTLVKSDVQKFVKRLRKAHGLVHRTIKYYAVGEYGSRTYRPHYHIILFNARVELVQTAWDLGQVHYGTVEGASIGYCLKYITKPKRVPQYKGDTRIPEFALMSKGLGLNYLTDQMVQYHGEDLLNRMYCTIEDGKKISMPRYYKDKLYFPEERKAIAQAYQDKYRDLYVEDPLKRDQQIKAAFQKMERDSIKNNKI
ncbi:MAG: replication initiator protein [Microviridae sp.]|nr:MAG: replication initiator protein [Microviridae sp.]